jgi:zinc protease
MSDLERITLADVKSWYRRYYNPANAIVVVAGDVRAADVRLLVNKLFGKMKGALARPDSFVEPPQQGERRFEYRKDVRMPAIGIQYQTVSVLDPDAYALNLIAMILSQGRSSRFQRETVREKNLAADIYAYSATAKYGGTFIAFGIPQAGVDVKTLETEIENQMERLKTEKVAAEELDKAKRLVMAQTIYRQDAPTGIGFTIANWENTTGDWNNINRFPEEIQKVTADDIQRIARKYLIKENRTVGYLLPSERSEEK